MKERRQTINRENRGEGKRGEEKGDEREAKRSETGNKGARPSLEAAKKGEAERQGARGRGQGRTRGKGPGTP